MSVTYRDSDIYITRRDTYSSGIKKDGVPMEFPDNAVVTMTIWDNAEMGEPLFSKSFTPDEDKFINIQLEPAENNFEYGTYYYSLLYTRTGETYRNTLIPESNETCVRPKYVVCRGDGDV